MIKIDVILTSEFAQNLSNRLKVNVFVLLLTENLFPGTSGTSNMFGGFEAFGDSSLSPKQTIRGWCGIDAGEDCVRFVLF